MDDLLTTRQVQDVLKVDRITVYRMLQDGRLKGVKIGQQWRFLVSEVERLVDGSCAMQPVPGEAAPSNFPTHCVQTIQDLFAELSQAGALVLDSTGQPLTQNSRPCPLCTLIQSSPDGLAACRQTWQDLAQGKTHSGWHTCHAGLDYTTEAICDGRVISAWFIAGQFYTKIPNPIEQDQRCNDLAHRYGIKESLLANAMTQVVICSPEHLAEMGNWPQKATKAIESILKERAAFMDRLQKIAAMTQI